MYNLREQIDKFKNWTDKNHGLLLRNNKKFWIGSVNVYDGLIEEVHTYEEAEDMDFHHSFYFSQPQLEKIDSEECMIFWVDEDGVNGNWTHGEVPIDIIYEIMNQIKVV